MTIQKWLVQLELLRLKVEVSGLKWSGLSLGSPVKKAQTSDECLVNAESPLAQGKTARK